MSTQQKLQSQVFVIFIFSFIAFIYFSNVKLVWIDLRDDAQIGRILYLIIFHIFFIMLLWSLIKTMITDPGKVPMYWGYFLDDTEHKQRRYCLICHNSQPQRCHHCSACNRCVLNMDHHCPWINNCVGFYNRKFFILMLTYIMLTSITVFFGMIPTVITILKDFKLLCSGKQVNDNWFDDVLILIAFILDATAIGVIGLFYQFHLELVLSNTTTIESLDKKRSNGAPHHGGTNFDMGPYYNWVQVFGQNQWLWPFPLFFDTGKPVGDGVVWPQRVSLGENFDKEKETSQDAITNTPTRSNRENLNDLGQGPLSSGNGNTNINNNYGQVGNLNSGIGNSINNNASNNYQNNGKFYNQSYPSNVNQSVTTNNTTNNSNTYGLNNYNGTSYANNASNSAIYNNYNNYSHPPLTNNVSAYGNDESYNANQGRYNNTNYMKGAGMGTSYSPQRHVNQGFNNA